MEDAVVEDFHDCEFQDAAEGFDEDLDLGEEVPLRPVTPGANPLVSKFLYVHVYCILCPLLDFFTWFSEVVLPCRLSSQRQQKSAGSSLRQGSHSRAFVLPAGLLQRCWPWAPPRAWPPWGWRPSPPS